MNKSTEIIKWKNINIGVLEIKHNAIVKEITWHYQGDYFATLLRHGVAKVSLIFNFQIIK